MPKTLPLSSDLKARLPTSEKSVILNVDDAEAQRYALARTLEGAGFTVWQAATGREGLEKAARLPDLVILDVKLPDMSGFEVCRRIKSDPRTSFIPVLHQSAIYVDTQFRVSGLESGADGYLVHPVEPEELLAMVRALLRLHRVERELRDSESRYRMMFDSSPMACCVFDLDTLRLLEVNEAALKTYGYSPAEFRVRKLDDLWHPEDLPRLWELLTRDPFGGASEARHVCRDGTFIDVEGSWRAIQVKGKQLGLAIFHDVTERNRMKDAEAAAQVRREVLGRLMDTQESERRHIARELHDEAGQLLASLLVGLRAVSGSKRLEDARRQARQLRSLASQTMEEISNLARGLHPTILDDMGLTEALRRLLEEYEKRHQVRTAMKNGHCHPDRLPSAVQIGLYRIIQEALTNVARHSQAKSAEVRFKSLPEGVEVTIADDGKGFDAANRKPGSHLGLQSMRERAALLGGRVSITSGPRGTQIVATIPTGKRSFQRRGNTG